MSFYFSIRGLFKLLLIFPCHIIILIIIVLHLLLCGNLNSTLLTKSCRQKPNSVQNFSVQDWNMNSIPAHNFSKISFLSAYNFLHKFDIICLSETYLDSSILPQDPNIEMQTYTLIRTDHPSNVKRGGVCVYYKNHLPLKLLNINYL